MGTLIINPYLNRLWTPAEIATTLWLDSADSSTITESGGAISQWDDKSPNGKSYTATAGQEPTYTSAGLNGLSIVSFDGTECLRANDVGLSTGNYSFACVTRINSTLSLGQFQTILHYGSNDTGQAVFIMFGEDSNFPNDAIGISQYGDGVGITNSAQADIIFTGKNTSNSFSLRKDGGSATASKTMTSNVVLSGFSTIGAYNASLGGSFLNGYIAELILTNTSESDLTLQKIEGYLAHKWGLTANLPVSHPYKNNSPYV